MSSIIGIGDPVGLALLCLLALRRLLLRRKVRLSTLVQVGGSVMALGRRGEASASRSWASIQSRRFLELPGGLLPRASGAS